MLILNMLAISMLASMSIPVPTIVFGWIIWKLPPKKINRFYGYHTRMAMKTPETWKFAQEYFGKRLWKMGLGMTIPLIFQVLEWIIQHGSWSDLDFFFTSFFLLLGQILALILLIPLVEKALKQNFNPDGTKKAGV